MIESSLQDTTTKAVSFTETLILRLTSLLDVGRLRCIKGVLRIFWTLGGFMRCTQTAKIYYCLRVVTLAAISIFRRGHDDGRFCDYCVTVC